MADRRFENNRSCGSKRSEYCGRSTGRWARPRLDGLLHRRRCDEQLLAKDGAVKRPRRGRRTSRRNPISRAPTEREAEARAGLRGRCWSLHSSQRITEVIQVTNLLGRSSPPDPAASPTAAHQARLSMDASAARMKASPRAAHHCVPLRRLAEPTWGGAAVAPPVKTHCRCLRSSQRPAAAAAAAPRSPPQPPSAGCCYYTPD